MKKIDLIELTVSIVIVMTILSISVGLIYIVIFHLLTVIKVILITIISIITVKLLLVLGIKNKIAKFAMRNVILGGFFSLSLIAFWHFLKTLLHF